MSSNTEQLLAEVLQLSHDEQDKFLTRLIDRLDPPAADIDHMSDEEFAKELARRAEELRADPTAGVPWDQVREMR